MQRGSACTTRVNCSFCLGVQGKTVLTVPGPFILRKTALPQVQQWTVPANLTSRGGLVTCRHQEQSIYKIWGGGQEWRGPVLLLAD